MWLLWKANRKSYAIYHMVQLSVNLSDTILFRKVWFPFLSLVELENVVCRLMMAGTCLCVMDYSNRRHVQDHVTFTFFKISDNILEIVPDRYVVTVEDY